MATRLQIQLPGEDLAVGQQDKEKLPRVYSGERLYGTLLVSTSDGSQPVFDHADIIFEGNITSFIHNSHEREGISWTSKQKLVDCRDSLQAVNFHSSAAANIRNSALHTSFFFDIPTTVMESATEAFYDKSSITAFSDKSGLLPPSLSLRKPYSQATGPGAQSEGISGTCEVGYHLRARLTLQDRVIAECTRKVLLIPVTEAAPPLDVRDFPGEYILSTTSSIVNLLKVKKQGQLSAAIAEPEPLVISLDNPTSWSTTTLPLKLRLRTTSKATPSISELSDCIITSGLEATSFFSVVPQTFALSTREASRLSYVARTEWKAKPQARKLRLQPWKSVPAAENTWETSTTVLVSPQLDSAALLLPTFRSPLVSRRFALSVKVKLRSQKERLTHLSLDLKTPIQVLYTRSNLSLSVLDKQRGVEDAIETLTAGMRALMKCEVCQRRCEEELCSDGDDSLSEHDEPPLYTCMLSSTYTR